MGDDAYRISQLSLFVHSEGFDHFKLVLKTF